MPGQFARLAALGMGILFVFGAVAAILARVIPGPHSSTDYLVIGTVATFVSLLALFVVLIKTWVKSPDLFFKRRNKTD